MQREDRIVAALLAVYIAWWLVLAWSPHDRFIWFTENLLVFVGVPVLVLTHQRFRFSLASYVAMFVFLMVHAVGAHYGYTKVPIPWHEWGFARNETDRVAHLLFGLLAVLPVSDLLRRFARLTGGWLSALSVACTFALAAAFEIVEWVAVVVGGDAVGPVNGGYLGWQGDPFDAVKDMALGLAGAVVTVLVRAAARRRTAVAAHAP